MSPESHHPALPHEQHELRPLAAFLAWVFPGLGHWHLGERRRAVWIAGGVLGMFVSGMLIGGVGVVDSGLIVTNALKRSYSRITGQTVKLDRTDGEPIWFLGQAFTGPVAFAADYVTQYRLKVRDPVRTDVLRPARPDETRDAATGQARRAGPGEGPPHTQALGRVSELGTLFCTIAGMMNLICIIDAAARRKRPLPAIGGQGA